MKNIGVVGTWIAIVAVMAAVFGSLVYSSPEDDLNYLRVYQAHTPAFWE